MGYGTGGYGRGGYGNNPLKKLWSMVKRAIRRRKRRKGIDL
jgi:hypothetical protein